VLINYGIIFSYLIPSIIFQLLNVNTISILSTCGNMGQLSISITRPKRYTILSVSCTSPADGNTIIMFSHTL
ncbi:hypothetical protein EB632_10275, partial [Escherichia coli]|nr:hypothetical protein [Escherichia coli]